MMHPGPALGSFLCRDFHAGSVNRLPCPAFCGVAGVPLRPIEGLWNEDTPLRTLPLPLVAPGMLRRGREKSPEWGVLHVVAYLVGRGNVGLSEMKDAEGMGAGATRRDAGCPASDAEHRKRRLHPGQLRPAAEDRPAAA